MTIRAKFASSCQHCNAAIAEGDLINWVRGVRGVSCARCPLPVDRPAGWRPCGYPGCNPSHCDECDGEGRRAGRRAPAAALAPAPAPVQPDTARVERLRAALAESEQRTITLANERDGARMMLTRLTSERDEARRERDELKVCVEAASTEIKRLQRLVDAYVPEPSPASSPVTPEPSLEERQAAIAEAWGAIEDSPEDDCPI